MKPKSLFIIILKIIGLFLLLDIFRVLPQFLSTFTKLYQGDIASGIFGAIISLLLIGVYLFLIKHILFNPDKIVDKLQLDKNFDEETFELNIHRSTIIKIAVIFIGSMTLLDYFVPFILNLYSYIQAKNEGDIMNTFSGNNPVSGMDLIHGGIMILVGYFLVTNSRTISNWIEKLRKDK